MQLSVLQSEKKTMTYDVYEKVVDSYNNPNNH